MTEGWLSDLATSHIPFISDDPTILCLQTSPVQFCVAIRYTAVYVFLLIRVCLIGNSKTINSENGRFRKDGSTFLNQTQNSSKRQVSSLSGESNVSI